MPNPLNLLPSIFRRQWSASPAEKATARANIGAEEILNATVLTSGTTMEAGKNYIYNSTSAFAVAPKFPASPTIGQSLSVIDTSGNSGTENKALDGNGTSIGDGVVAPGAMFAFDEANFRKVVFVYNGTLWCAMR